MMTKEEKIRMVQSRQWYHSIDLGDGLVTPGQRPLTALMQMLHQVGFPDSFEGLSVLDIGTWDGFFSFEAEKRGAKRVVAVDLDPPDFHGFSTARALLDSRVEYIQGSAYDLSPEIQGTFDVVFFFGVFYHLRYPLLALDRIRAVTRQYMLMETNCMDKRLILGDGSAVRLQDLDRRLVKTPLYRFYRFDELNRGDFSNWFSPNRRAVEDALWTAGFEPEFLYASEDRVAFKGTALPNIPEYLLQTYEGLRWVDQADGTRKRIFHERKGAQGIAGEISIPRAGADRDPNLGETGLDQMTAPVNSGTEAGSDELQNQVTHLRSRIAKMERVLKSIQCSKAYRLLRRLGRWKWFERAITEMASTQL